MSISLNTQISGNAYQTNLNLRPKISKENEILKNQIIAIGMTNPDKASMLSRKIVMWDGSQKALDDLSAEGLNVSHFGVCRLLGGMLGNDLEETDVIATSSSGIDLSKDKDLINATLTREDFLIRYRILEKRFGASAEAIDLEDFKTMKKKIITGEQFEERYSILEGKLDKSKNEETEFNSLEAIAEGTPEGKVLVQGHPKFNFYHVDFDQESAEVNVISAEERSEWKAISALKKESQIKILTGLYDIPIGKDLSYSILFPTEDMKIIAKYQTLCDDFESFPREGLEIVSQVLSSGTFYSKSHGLQSHSLFCTDFVDTLKHTYTANLSLLKASNLMVPEPVIYKSILEIYTESFDLYQDQIDFNKRNEKVLLDFSKKR